MVKIDAYRRNLQRGYLDLMGDKLNGRAAVTDDQRPFIRGELRALNDDVAKALVRTTDRATRMHLEDVRDQIAKILDPKFQLANPTPGPAILLPLSTSGARDDIFCWTDYAIHVE